MTAGPNEVPAYILRELERQRDAEAKARLRAAFGLVGPVEALLPDGPREVLHACPDHPTNEVPPLCPVCLGCGLVDDERLARYQAWLWRDREGPL
ncbi:MAG: hypothetical protein AUG44_03430 [Actinobacteria bacterium 13_1_20CM_3_71_11]|nr:MAG: hypothetical protein AUG44_03430 [Actinobacteria bacterium 13_1_20CM_3_71_11]